MKLCYRGVSYEYIPPALKIASGEPIGKYRGLECRSRHLETMPMEQPSFELQYRGVAYRTGSPVVADRPAAVPASEPVSTPVLPMTDKARSMMIKQGRDIKKRQQAMLGRLAMEVGLDNNFSDYWNRIQGKIHPTFRMNYDRNRVSFS